jgi:hypothetical protein
VILYETACGLLRVLLAAFSTAGRPFARAYTSDGSANWEINPALIVEWDSREPRASAGPASPADMSSGNLSLRMLFTIHTLRAPVWPASDEAGNPPSPAKIQENAKLVTCDAELVLETLLTAMRNNDLLGVCGKMEFVSQAAVIPEALVGSETKILVTP